MSMTLKTELKHFYDQVGEKYPEEEQVYQTLRGKLRRRFILAQLENAKGTFLDLGCNQGMYLQLYQNGPRFGVDLSLPVLKKARARAYASPEPIFIAGDAEALHFFRPESVDFVLCSEVLEHCLNPTAIFSGIAHVLKSGGTVLLTTPNYTRKRPEWIGLGTLKNYQIHSGLGDSYYHTAYRPEELQRFAEAAGLRVQEVGTLEKEVRYAAKIPAAILLLNRGLNRLFFHSDSFARWNEALFEKLSLTIYAVARRTGIHTLLMSQISEGVRSFIIAQKLQEAREK